MKVSLASLLALLALFFVHSCNNEPPTKPDEPIALSLSLLDSTCTDVELKLSAPSASGQRLVIERYAQPAPVVIFDAVLNKPDTSILDTDLLPNTTYTYRAYHLANNAKRDSTPTLLARTMDTTSHDWTWTMQTFGDFGSSAFYDVAIVNDTLAYAVGEIYLRDSLGQTDPQPYGFAIWNGQTWTFQKVPMRDYGTTELFPGRLFTILALGANNVYACSYANLLHWNGNSWQEKAFFMTEIPFNGQVNKMWGDNANNIYCVGRTGAIYHYNGSSWRKIESGTSLDIYDIYGDGEEVLAVGSSPRTTFERLILKISNQQSQVVSATPIANPLSALWFRRHRQYWVSGSGVYQKRHLGEDLWKDYDDITPFYTFSMAGSDVNDVFAVGGFGEVMHYNGISWYSYYEQLQVNGNYLGVAQQRNLSIVVGQDGAKGVLTVGRRSLEEGGRNGK